MNKWKFDDFSYALGFAFVNCMWSLATLGTKLSLFSTFTLCMSLFGLVISKKGEKS